jgi:hypothetical protein
MLCVTRPGLAPAQQVYPPEKIPSTFTADAVFAARFRSLVLPYSEAAAARFATGTEVMQQLVKKLPADGTRFSWNLRIAKDAGNVFSSPDGTILVDESLAELLGPRAGLWAAVLSHEIFHVVRRDWARRYLFQESLEAAGTSQLTLGDSSSGSWVDPRSATDRFASFCQETELEADAAGLMLMSRAGFHPDFMPALYHLIEAQPRQIDGKLRDDLHPRWRERDQKLQKLRSEAEMEYDRLWPDRYASPGGDPPIVVYADGTTAKRARTGLWEVLTPLHCENLSGAVEVVLRLTDAGSGRQPSEERQFTGCTSNRTLITFNLPDRKGQSRALAEISVLDDNGTLLTRTRASIPRR